MTTRPFDFAGARGQTLSGALETPDGPPRGYALFAHCFACTKASLAAARISRALARLGIGVLRFDFTGLGESAGDFGEATFSADVADLAAAVAAMEAAGVAPSLMIGHSLGGAAVLAAAGDLAQIKAVATLAAPFDVHTVTGQFGEALAQIKDQGEGQVTLGGHAFTVRRSFLDDLDQQDQKTRIASLRRPLLILHAPHDTVVGIDNASAIFLTAHHPKSFVCLDHGDHLLTHAQDADYAAQVIAAWASRYLPPAAAPAVVEGAQVSETGAGRFQLDVRTGGIGFLADEPVEVGGLGSGPSPYDLVSAGLGACTAMTLRLYAEHKALPLAKVSVAVSHAKVEGQTPPDRFNRVITLEGDLTSVQKLRLIEIAERCPVHKTLTAGSVVTTTAAEPAKPPATAPDDHFNAMCEACGVAGAPPRG